jgi:hypothetical protein
MKQTKRYGVPNTSFFDKSPYYQADTIKQIVEDNGGKNIRLRHAFDMVNQPKIVTFSASEDVVKKIESDLNKAHDTQWITIRLIN